MKGDRHAPMRTHACRVIAAHTFVYACMCTSHLTSLLERPPQGPGPQRNHDEADDPIAVAPVLCRCLCSSHTSEAGPVTTNRQGQAGRLARKMRERTRPGRGPCVARRCPERPPSPAAAPSSARPPIGRRRQRLCMVARWPSAPRGRTCGRALCCPGRGWRNEWIRERCALGYSTDRFAALEGLSIQNQPRQPPRPQCEWCDGVLWLTRFCRCSHTYTFTSGGACARAPPPRLPSESHANLTCQHVHDAHARPLRDQVAEDRVDWHRHDPCVGCGVCGSRLIGWLLSRRVRQLGGGARLARLVGPTIACIKSGVIPPINNDQI